MTSLLDEVTQNISELVREIELKADKPEALSHLLSDVWTYVNELKTCDSLVLKSASQNLNQLEQCAVTLWNIAVSRKTAGVLSNASNANMRQIAFELVRACKDTQESEDVLSQLSMMAMKTCKACLENRDDETAEQTVTYAREFLERLEQAAKRTDSDGQKLHRIYRDLFKSTCYHIEAMVQQGKHQEALEKLADAETMLNKLPQEGLYLCLLCYNFGVESFDGHHYEDCVAWLRRSYDLGKSIPAMSSKNQGRTLRLLANAYLEWEPQTYLQQALNAVSLANAECLHPAGLFLKLRTLLIGDYPDEKIKSGAEELIRNPELSVDLALTTARLLQSQSRVDLAVEVLNALGNRYKSHPSDWGKIQACHVDVLLSNNRETDAQQVVENCITGHRTGQTLEIDVLKHFHALIWKQAAKYFEAASFKDALTWYNYSLSLHGNSSSEGRTGKLHRNKATCYLATGDIDQADAAIQQAEQCVAPPPYTYYLKFKVAMLKGNEDQALLALDEMCHADEMCCASVEASSSVTMTTADVPQLICLAAQLAFEKNHQSIAMAALERLSQKSSDLQQVIVALRCLTRMALSQVTEPSPQHICTVRKYLEMAYDRLSTAVCRSSSELYSADIVWFLKTAWNLALQCSDDSPEMASLFILCSKMTSLNPPCLSGLQRQKACLLMASASHLYLAKLKPDDQKAHLHAALELIKECRDLYNHITADEDAVTDTTTPVLLILYETEARLKLGDGDIENLLDQAIALPHAQPMTFETIAALALESGRNDLRSVGVRAIKVAIKKHTQAAKVDLPRCSQCFHSLIKLAMQTGNHSNPGSFEEAWGYYSDVVGLIDTTKGQYPEMEVLWLMTTAWNTAMHLYNCGHLKSAVSWCELSLKLLKVLSPPLQTTYSPQMSGVYSEILEKIDKSFQQMTVA